MLLRHRTQSVASPAGRADGLASYNAPQWGQKNFAPSLAFHLWAMLHLPDVAAPPVPSLCIMYTRTLDIRQIAPVGRARVAEPQAGSIGQAKENQRLTPRRRNAGLRRNAGRPAWEWRGEPAHREAGQPFGRR